MIVLQDFVRLELSVLTVRINWTLEKLEKCGIITSMTETMGWCGVSKRPVWYHIHGGSVCAVGCARGGDGDEFSGLD